MIPWMLGLALAGPPASVSELETAGPVAAARIAHCERMGPECGLSDEDLAHAFVLRAAWKAVSTGEIDLEATASALALDPDATRGWEDLLPAGRSEPEPWLDPWLDGTSTPQVRPATVTRPEPEPRPVPREPFGVRGRVPVEAELGMLGGTRKSTWAPGVAVRVQLPVAGAAYVRTDGLVRQGLNDIQWPVRWGIPGGLGDPTPTQELWGRFVAGARWARPGGAELAFGGGWVGGVSRMAPSAEASLSGFGLDVGRRTFGMGLAFGGSGAHPLVSHGRLQLAWDGWIHLHADTSDVDRQQFERVPDNDAIAAATPLRSPVLALSLRYRGQPTGAWWALGGRFEWAQAAPGYSQPYGIPSLQLSAGLTGPGGR